MPFKKTYSRRTRRRRGRRGRGKARITRTLFGNKLVTKLKYQESFNLDPAAGNPAVQVFSCNGIFDPNITGTGHQPRGFDQLMVMFSHYVVISTKITFSVGVNASAAFDSVMFITPKQTPTVGTSLNDYLEQRFTRHKYLGAGPSATPGQITYKLNPNKFLGRSHPLSDSQLKGAQSVNPVEQVFFHCAHSPLLGADLGQSICSAVIEYTVIFIEPRLPAQS